MFTSIPTQALMCLSVETIIIKPKIKAEELKTTRGPSKRLITRRNFGEDFQFWLTIEELFKKFEKNRLENPILTFSFSIFFTRKKLLLKRQPWNKLFFILSAGIQEFNLFHIKETGLPPTQHQETPIITPFGEAYDVFYKKPPPTTTQKEEAQRQTNICYRYPNKTQSPPTLQMRPPYFYEKQQQTLLKQLAIA